MNTNLKRKDDIRKKVNRNPGYYWTVYEICEKGT